jgi:hypothetical protein
VAAQRPRATTDIDVLAPDGHRKAARTVGKLETIQIPGRTQALERSEVVEIVVDGVPSRVRRPTLLGALLLKARALPVHSRPEDQREDIITLLALVDDPDAMRGSLTQAERRPRLRQGPHFPGILPVTAAAHGVSSSSVTGPSLTSSTAMSAPNTPRLAPHSSQKRW